MKHTYIALALTAEGEVVFTELSDKGQEDLDSGINSGTDFWKEWSEADSLDNILKKVRELLTL